MKALRTIVIAWVEMTNRKQLLGKFVPEAKAVVWLLEGTEEDLAKARAYAPTLGATHAVYTFEVSEPDPLGAARKQILAEQGHGRHA